MKKQNNMVVLQDSEFLAVFGGGLAEKVGKFFGEVERNAKELFKDASEEVNEFKAGYDMSKQQQANETTVNSEL